MPPAGDASLVVTFAPGAVERRRLILGTEGPLVSLFGAEPFFHYGVRPDTHPPYVAVSPMLSGRAVFSGLATGTYWVTFHAPQIEGVLTYTKREVTVLSGENVVEIIADDTRSLNHYPDTWAPTLLHASDHADGFGVVTFYTTYPEIYEVDGGNRELFARLEYDGEWIGDSDRISNAISTTSAPRCGAFPDDRAVSSWVTHPLPEGRYRVWGRTLILGSGVLEWSSLQLDISESHCALVEFGSEPGGGFPGSSSRLGTTVRYLDVQTGEEASD